MDQWILIDLVLAYILDLLIGDPHFLYHPVCLIGEFIAKLEKILRIWIERRNEKRRVLYEIAVGLILAVATVSFSFGSVWLLLRGAVVLGGGLLYHILNIYFIYSAFATRCLAVEAGKVRDALSREDLADARRKVGMLVGRETDTLTQDEIIRAVVETTAENTVDGVISTIFYAVIGSLLGLAAPLVYAFKAVSTLDSMVGYKNERYLYFGRASAKIDDGANFFPARLSGLLIPCSAFLAGKSFGRSWRIMLRDRRRHSSPNCAYPEAAVAGALGVRLGGNNVYFGRVVEKPTLGDALRPLEIGDIDATVKLMYLASLLGMGLGILVLLWLGV
ncbi:MAG TPA: cobalamin biosynthesis protein CobD [Firmicutes bacterium]|jgi:adenosylcobinamide-phosphate synthase|nr:cobalamin biosynthesis protein CobD [Bacillota bacterium]